MIHAVKIKGQLNNVKVKEYTLRKNICFIPILFIPQRSKCLFKDIYGRGIIIGGDWNQYPDGYEPSSDETGNPYFSIAALDYECMQEYGKTFYGRECKTLRYLYAPLDSSTTRTISDFFFVSDGISVISTQAIDLGFENSDHNPVIAVVAL